MRKLKLNLGDLEVDSFDIPNGTRRRGTLFARSGHDSGTEATVCWGLTCPACGDTAYVFCTAQDCGTGGGGGGSADTTCQNTVDVTCVDCPSADGYCTGHADGC
ncbi:MAG: hypothetical protein JO306_01190 [Gemmatimonadetes bacterium]|nr:hypothetical protein [Gemmatimonadota bacterium]